MLSDPDVFWRSDVYQDARALLAFSQRPIADMRDGCLVVLDANVLLQPYEVDSKEAVNEIERVYRKLAHEDRLVVPGQSIREYQTHRPRKLAAVASKLEGFITSFTNLQLGRVPLLEAETDFQAVREAVREAKARLEPAVAGLRAEVTKLRSDDGSDRIATLYRQVLAPRVVDPPLDAAARQDLVSECRRRSRLDIAPGCADADKPDLCIGDLLVWRTALEEGARRNVDCLFVTLETKPDWWVKQNGAFLPRPELVEEYRARTERRTVRLVSLSQLLEIYAAPREIVSEVKQSEDAQATRLTKQVFYRTLAEPVRRLQFDLAETDRRIEMLQTLLDRLRAREGVDPDDAFRSTVVAMQRELSHLGGKRDSLTDDLKEMLISRSIEIAELREDCDE